MSTATPERPGPAAGLVPPGEGRPAVVLLSGGLDSATTMALALAAGWDVHALSFDYGQRHSVELTAAHELTAAAGVTDHRIAHIDLRTFGGSALTDDLDVPKPGAVDAMDDGVPITYVPARNTIFLAFGLAFCEVLDATDLFIGVNAVDYSGYPDCRPEFLAAFEATAALATRAAVEDGRAVRIHAPLSGLAKADIIRAGAAVGVDFAMTTSCYDPEPGGACGACDSCVLRRAGFVAAGIDDPTCYAARTP